MSEPKEAHKIRMRLKRSHPDWTNEMIRNEINKSLQGSHSGSQVHKSSQPPEKEGSQEFTKVHSVNHHRKQSLQRGIYSAIPGTNTSLRSTGL